MSLFLSTLSLRRATEQSSSYNAYLEISIHALLAESDSMRIDTGNSFGDFYPRSPCGERPRPPAPPRREYYISIHALLAESDGIHYDNYNLHCVISIHALLAESDFTSFGWF